MLKFEKPLIIFEMANNHMGDVEHGLHIIDSLAEVTKNFPFDFAVKFQYRNLDTFIHPDFTERMDLKFVKRFSETRITEEDFLTLKKAVEDKGFKTICTPFDEDSVDMIVKHQYDYLKIASCSIRDWPLLEKIAEADLPIIASSGGASIQDMDKVVSFFKHKDKSFALMHCVGVYPTENEDLMMNRIDWFKDRYRDIPIGFSTHEKPDETLPAIIAVGKNAQIFERHVGIKNEKYDINGYSSTPEQVKKWLEAIKAAFDACGPKDINDFKVSEAELKSLEGLKRGAFARRPIDTDERFGMDDVFFAMPNTGKQMTAENFSKHHTSLKSKKAYKKNDAIEEFEIEEVDVRAKIANIIHTMNSQLNQARIVLNPESDIELSHHYGVEKIEETGVVMVTCINKEYCKKLLVQIPGQFHPEHAHKIKEETFQILWGSMYIKMEGETKKYLPGDIVTVERGAKHSFWTDDGVVVEEVSTTHVKDDSYYSDDNIAENDKRKTNLKDWWMRV